MMRESTPSKASRPPRPPFRSGRDSGMVAVIKWLEDQDLSLSWLGEQIEMSRQAVSAWDAVPLPLLPQISKITGLPPQKLRPDIFAIMNPK